MRDKNIILENKAKKNEVQSPGENESSPLFSVDMSQMIQDAQKQNGFPNSKFQQNATMLTNLTNESERGIQLELNRNYLKSFPARLKFCHVFLGSLTVGLLLYNFSEHWYSDHYLSLTWIPISIQSTLALCSLIFLVTSTMIWKADGKIQMARINFVFHTVAIILLILSTCILLIGIISRILSDVSTVPFAVTMFVSSALNVLNGLLYYTSIKLVLTTCENY